MSKVYIIGTGPGDEDLLTLKAVKVLNKCTAVLYDRLVGNNVLNYLSDNCEIYYCGKEPGCHYKTQEEINDMIVQLAKKGHIVGRVKGGDPYVFGRGGEEVLAAIEHNIPFEVVPGVTSPISVLNYGGIPITQRGMAQDFHIVTGMSAGVSKINWSALANENGTLVFMMGLDNLDKIKNNLVSNGKKIDTPCAVVMRGTSSKQKKVIGTLENIEEKVVEAGLKSPCIIVVGEVVTLHDQLAWYENLPLFGANICVTRSRNQSSNLKNALKDLGAEVTEMNSIKISPTPNNLSCYIDKLNSYDHIILTSVNGVNVFFDYLIEKNYDVRNIKAKFSVVGSATKKALLNRGLVPFIMAREFHGEGLFNVIKPHLLKNEKVLIPSSSSSRQYLYEEITKLGLEVDKIDTYDTLPGDVRNPKAFEEVDLVLYTSPSTVNNMIDMVGADNIKNKINVAIGPQTKKALDEHGIESMMCKVHTETGFLNEIVNMWQEIKSRG